MHYARAGWSEQDPIDWWRAVTTSARALLSEAQVDPADIATVTFSGQMMGIVPIDGAGQPLRSAIIWADQRAVEEAEMIGTWYEPIETARIVSSRSSTPTPLRCGGYSARQTDAAQDASRRDGGVAAFL